MGETRTQTRETVVSVANGLARSVLYPVVKEAVEDAMREAEHEDDTSGSSGRRLPLIALVVLGVVVGGYLVRRRMGEEPEFEHRIEQGPSEEEPAEPESAEDEEAVTSSSG